LGISFPVLTEGMIEAHNHRSRPEFSYNCIMKKIKIGSLRKFRSELDDNGLIDPLFLNQLYSFVNRGQQFDGCIITAKDLLRMGMKREEDRAIQSKLFLPFMQP